MAAFQKLDELSRRVLCHTTATSAEISYFQSSFENEKKDKTLQNLTDIQSNLQEKTIPNLENAIQLSDSNLADIGKLSYVIIEKMNRIFERSEEESPLPPDIAANKNGRVERWTLFVDDMCRRTAEIDSSFAQRQADLQTYYDELEQKLASS